MKIALVEIRTHDTWAWRRAWVWCLTHRANSSDANGRCIWSIILYSLICLDCLLVSDSDPFFSIDLHRLNTRAIAERFGNIILATGGGGGGTVPLEAVPHPCESPSEKHPKRVREIRWRDYDRRWTGGRICDSQTVQHFIFLRWLG